MPVLSVLRRSFPPLQSLKKSWNLSGSEIQTRNKRTMNITGSRWSWQQFKNYFHFYLALGVIPLSTFVFLINIYVGPAQLREIPEGYIPENWEYYKHPISRWMAKNVYPSHQEEYERLLWKMWTVDDSRQMNVIQRRVKSLMHSKGDSTSHFTYRPPVLEYIMEVREDFETEERECMTIEGPP